MPPKKIHKEFKVIVRKKPLTGMWYKTRIGETFIVNKIMHPFSDIEVYKVVDHAAVNQLFIYIEDCELIEEIEPVKTIKSRLPKQHESLVEKVKGVSKRTNLNYSPYVKIKLPKQKAVPFRMGMGSQKF